MGVYISVISFLQETGVSITILVQNVVRGKLYNGIYSIFRKNSSQIESCGPHYKKSFKLKKEIALILNQYS